MDKFAIPKKNFIYIIIGLLVMIVGYLFMLGGGAESPDEFNYELFSFSRLYIAPLLILIGFGIEIFAIMRIRRKKEEEE